MIIYSPAKINLHLKVIRKRPDGYHELEIFFEKIALFDRIALSVLKKNKIEITCNNPEVPCNKDSLLYRTIDGFKKKFGVRDGIRVRLYKNIPLSSGLGGGSSNAASVILALSRLYLDNRRFGDILKFGGQLGSDIPFFLHRCSFALGYGRGEKIFPFKWKNKFWHLLICPPYKLLSKEIYSAYDKLCLSDLTDIKPVVKIHPFDYAKNGLLKQSKNTGNTRLSRYRWISGLLYNDLERVVIKKIPMLARLKNLLYNKGIRTYVSGSGSSMFCLFTKRKEAEQVCEDIVNSFSTVRGYGWKLFVVSTV